MNSVFHGTVMYCFLLLVFRISGKRTLAQVTPFDFVLLLIISETTQQALIGTDYSLTGACLLILTLVGLDILLSLWKQRSPTVEKVLEDMPLVIVRNGKLLKERMEKERINEADVLFAARQCQGLERLEQIKYGILECDGSITVVPAQGEQES